MSKKSIFNNLGCIIIFCSSVIILIIIPPFVSYKIGGLDAAIIVLLTILATIFMGLADGMCKQASKFITMNKMLGINKKWSDIAYFKFGKTGRIVLLLVALLWFLVLVISKSEWITGDIENTKDLLNHVSNSPYYVTVSIVSGFAFKLLFEKFFMWAENADWQNYLNYLIKEKHEKEKFDSQNLAQLQLEDLENLYEFIIIYGRDKKDSKDLIKKELLKKWVTELLKKCIEEQQKVKQ